MLLTLDLGLAQVMALARMLPLLNLPLPVVETSSFLALVQIESLSISNRVPRKKLGSLPL